MSDLSEDALDEDDALLLAVVRTLQDYHPQSDLVRGERNSDRSGIMQQSGEPTPSTMGKTSKLRATPFASNFVRGTAKQLFPK